MVNKKNINIDFKINIRHQLSKETLDYLADENSKLEWDIRGIAGHKTATAEELERFKKSKQKTADFVKSEEGLEVIKEFSKECIAVYTQLLYNKGFANEYLEGKKIIFVAGAVRTGGTHLASNIMESFDMKIEDYALSMIHDNFPKYIYLYRWSEIDVFQALLFEISQFLVWAKREFKDKPIIVKKRTAFTHALPFLYNIFGDNAEYIVTVRHPIPSGYSIAKKANYKIDEKLGLPLWKEMAITRCKASEEEFDQMNCMERFLIYWQICYEDVIRSLSPKQKIQIVNYDEESNDYIIKTIADKYNGENILSGFTPISRDYADVISEEKVSKAIEEVREMWRVHGLDFPNLEIR